MMIDIICHSEVWKTEEAVLRSKSERTHKYLDKMTLRHSEPKGEESEKRCNSVRMQVRPTEIRLFQSHYQIKNTEKIKNAVSF